jgi:hypothetical protein
VIQGSGISVTTPRRLRFSGLAAPYTSWLLLALEVNYIET